MKKLIPAFLVLAAVAVATGCSTQREVRTTTKETVQTVPADPVVIQHRTTTQTETRTAE